EATQDNPPFANKHQSFLIELLAGRQTFHIGWFQAAVVPGQLDRRHLVPGGKLELNDRGPWESFGEMLLRAGLLPGWRAQLQGPEDGVEAVLTHAAQGAAAEIEPAPPDERQIDMVERPLWCRAQPQVPVQPRRHRFHFAGAFQTLCPE